MAPLTLANRFTAVRTIFRAAVQGRRVSSDATADASQIGRDFSQPLGRHRRVVKRTLGSLLPYERRGLRYDGTAPTISSGPALVILIRARRLPTNACNVLAAWSAGNSRALWQPGARATFGLFGSFGAPSAGQPGRGSAGSQEHT